MTRLGLAKRFAEKGYPKKTAEKIVNELIVTMSEVLAEGESINLQNFGKFQVYDRRLGNVQRPNWVSSELGPDDTYKSIKFVPHSSLRICVCTGTPVVPDKRLGRYTSKYRYKRKTKDSGDV